MKAARFTCIVLAIALQAHAASPVIAAMLAAAPSLPAAALGRWDVTVYEPTGQRPSWFELTEDSHGLHMRYVGLYGAPQEIHAVQWGDRELAFSIPDPRGPWRVFRGTFNGSFFVGTTRVDNGHSVRWTARRVPTHRPPAPVTWGDPIALFNGRDLSGWRQRHDDAPPSWVVRDGALVSLGGDDLVSKRHFRDFKLHVVCTLPTRGDAGIHLRGRHEIQLLEDSGDLPPEERHASLYGFIAPSESASRSPGNPDTFDITLIGRLLTVVLNGQTVIESAEMPGITGDALNSDEGQPGPVMLQGYLGSVRFHEVVLTPAR